MSKWCVRIGTIWCALKKQPKKGRPTMSERKMLICGDYVRWPGEFRQREPDCASCPEGKGPLCDS